ncbi:MAG: ATPase domain-containing protein [Candidatus Hydrothermarchaeaceae archaeon]
MERTSTGIPGFDEMLEGGIPMGYTVLVAGGPGSGKSTFAMQYLYKGLTDYNENGLYITLEEGPKDLVRNFSEFGWDMSKVRIIGMIPQKASIASGTKYISPEELEKQKSSNILEFSPRRFSVDTVKDVITSEVEEREAKRLVIDSLASLSLQMDDAYEIRQEVLGLSNLLNDLGCTSLLLTEMPEGQSGISRYGVEEFMAQGVIALYNIRKGSERVRGLEILKMRGTKHSKKICLMEIAEKGIVVYPTEDLYREF